jgi:hypothetical protein
MMRRRTIVRACGLAAFLLAAAGFGVRYINADGYGMRLKWSLERSLGRRVDLGKVRFRLFPTPAFTVERNDAGPGVVIHEDPSIGIEPVAYVEELAVRPALLPLLHGRFRVASIQLDDASINLAKTGAADELGQWNFASFLNPSVMSIAPAIQIRGGRIHFKFGDTKSVFYLLDTDLDISPPAARGGGWRVACTARPARTDRASLGLGSFTLKGRWYVAPERVDLDLLLDRAEVGELTALFRGQAGNIHGAVTARLHLGGPIYDIGIQGRMSIDDVHRWDLLPPEGQGWPFDIRGSLDLLNQQIELQSNAAGGKTPPLAVRFRAADYLSRPRWFASLYWNHFELPPLMELATHMGAELPPRLKLAGTMDGALSYSNGGGLQGGLAFHDAALTIPDSPPVRFEHAYVTFEHGHARLSPAMVRTEQDQAQIEADYSADDSTFDLSIVADRMKLSALRTQPALAAVPWFEHVTSGVWTGLVRYRRTAESAGWTGRFDVEDAQIPVPGLAGPVELTFAHAQIDDARVVLERIEGHAGKTPFTGEYRYEPDVPRPHRLRLRIESADAALLESELMPTLSRSGNLIARALGRAPVPDWLRERALEGSLQIDELLLAGAEVRNLKSRIVWDVTRLDLPGLQAVLNGAALTGKLSINLIGRAPAYSLEAKVKGLNWQSGKVDAQGTLETSGTGPQLLANLASEGIFSGSALDFGSTSPWRTVSGSYSLAPHLRLSDVNLRAEDENYTGKGATQEDGRMVIVLSNGAKEMRMSGSLARLRIE